MYNWILLQMCTGYSQTIHITYIPQMHYKLHSLQDELLSIMKVIRTDIQKVVTYIMKSILFIRAAEIDD